MLNRLEIEIRAWRSAMEKAVPFPLSLIPFILSLILLFPDLSYGAPRAQQVKLICETKLEHNTTAFVPNFVGVMENISDKMRTTGWGTSILGSGPDRNFGLAQCYGDLSLLDCVLCYAEARTVLPQCFPFNGGRIYLDGCFMRAENYTFFEEYLGPGDTHVCGNSTRKDASFQRTARRAVMQAVSTVLNNNGSARSQLSVPGRQNETAYVLADCWKTLNASACRACLQKASASMLGCLPWSEGRALYTGCFMRYSDTNFLNPIPSNDSSSRGPNDAEKLVKILHDSSLNFKYSTLEKATGCFDEANKLGQGGFGTVYKGVLPDGREIAVKRLFFNNKHRAADFYNEVNIISSVEHKNLVRLLGCSCSGPESLLVYEYMHNQSLDQFIFAMPRLYFILSSINDNENGTTKQAWMHFQQGTVHELFDPNLMLHNYHNINVKNEVLRVVHIGLLCTQEAPSLRPSMSKALQMLVKREELPATHESPLRGRENHGAKRRLG
nr:cysteine-rich receptor-like protein kinase 2 isoform X1 [Ipomoea batatas]